MAHTETQKEANIPSTHTSRNVRLHHGGRNEVAATAGRGVHLVAALALVAALHVHAEVGEEVDGRGHRGRGGGAGAGVAGGRVAVPV